MALVGTAEVVDVRRETTRVMKDSFIQTSATEQVFKTFHVSPNDGDVKAIQWLETGQIVVPERRLAQLFTLLLHHKDSFVGRPVIDHLDESLV
jgi:hypothetical protein